MDTPIYSNQYVWQNIGVNRGHSAVLLVYCTNGRECHNNLVVGLCCPNTVYPGSPVVYVCGDIWWLRILPKIRVSRTEEAGWIQRGWIPNAFVKVVVMVVMVVILFIIGLVWWLTIVPTRVSSRTERAGYYPTRLDGYWVLMMVVRRAYRTSCFLCAGYDVPFGWYSMVCILWVWVCTVRYMFDDLIDKIVVATQQQMWVVWYMGACSRDEYTTMCMMVMWYGCGSTTYWYDEWMNEWQY